MTVQTEETQIDEAKVEQFAGQFTSDLSASYSGVMALIGHELGLYKAMEDKGPITAK